MRQPVKMLCQKFSTVTRNRGRPTPQFDPGPHGQGGHDCRSKKWIRANPGYPERKSRCRAVCWSSWFCFVSKTFAFGSVVRPNARRRSATPCKAHTERTCSKRALIFHQGLFGAWSTRCSSKDTAHIFGAFGSMLIHRDVRKNMLSSALQHTVVGCIAAEAGDIIRSRARQYPCLMA